MAAVSKRQRLGQLVRQRERKGVKKVRGDLSFNALEAIVRTDG